MVEPFNVSSERFIAPMDDCLERRLSLGVSSRGCEVSSQLDLQALPQGDRIGGEDFLQIHGSFPQSCGEKPALDDTPDVVKVEHCLEVVEVVVMVCSAIVAVQRWRFIHFLGNRGLLSSLG